MMINVASPVWIVLGAILLGLIITMAVIMLKQSTKSD
jgi:CHASE1-domain containing sensor protein